MPIRDLEPDDLVAACEIYNHYVATSTATFHEQPLDLRQFAAMLPRPSDRHGTWAIETDGALLAGFAYCGPFKSRSGYRDTAEVTIYLHPDHCGKGLGSAVLAHVESHARSGPLHALVAGACTENVSSVALFSRHGYAEVARFREVGRKFGRLLDVVYLEKLLG